MTGFDLAALVLAVLLSLYLLGALLAPERFE